MRLSTATGAALAVAALALGGCGSGTGAAGHASTSGGSGGSGNGQRLGAPSGREVFAQACEYCHSITGHMKPSQQGGDLRNYHAPLAELRRLTAEMPVLHHHRLSSAELTAVVAYVAAVERTSR